MKKNLVPLLGIAFVVALIATAIFYGLVSAKMTRSVQAKEERAEPAPDPLFQAAVELGVPSGMRAVSVRVADSSGLIEVLKPGHRVDVQAVYQRSDRPNDVELKTVLQNIEVWRVLPQPESSSGRHPLPVVTLLVTPSDADVLAVADAGASIRFALRNPGDAESVERNSVTMQRLLRVPPRPVR
jgi:Flp pilus assembly protein CpaB